MSTPTAKLRLENTRRLLDQFSWEELFVEELGWHQPSDRSSFRIEAASDVFTLQPVASLGGACVFVVSNSTGQIPDQKGRQELHKLLVSRQREHLLIFQNAAQFQTLWSWPRFEAGKLTPRTHLYIKGQPGDLFLSKLSNIYFDLNELDDTGQADLLTVTERLKKALDVRPVTREFYKVFSQQQHNVVAAVVGLPDEPRRRHYASVLLTRLMFVYFLQKKGLLDQRNGEYLEGKLAEHQAWATTQPQPAPTFYRRFLRELFFQGFALHPSHRDPAVAALLGTIPYLNGGLFLPHTLEQEHPDLDLPDESVQHLLGVFTAFSWNLDDRLGGKDNEINPDVLGYIFEKYINSNSSKQKGAGAFYTPTEITTYLCDKTVDGLLLRACNTPAGEPTIAGMKAYRFGTLDELMLHLDDRLARKLLEKVLPELALLDPACGSGAFLVAALKKLETVYAAVVGYVQVSATDPWLLEWLRKARLHASLGYFIKKEIITRNLFGVDLMDEAVEIARLRLFLALVAAAQKPEDLEPLPNIDFNLMEGNGLVGILHIQEQDFNKCIQGNLFSPTYQELVRQKNELIDRYKGIGDEVALTDTELAPLRNDIQAKLDDARVQLDQLLLDQFKNIKFQQARWDADKKKEAYTKSRLLPAHLRELRPFHWGYEFNQVLVERGGFDAIIANPPWETFKPNAKEFFEEYAEVVQKKNMSIEDFEKKKAELLQDPDLRHAWEAYLSRFPHVSEYFRASPDYSAQAAIVDGKNTSSDLNLYKLFMERSFRLLKLGGACGIIVPTGLYTDLGSKGLRQLLFDEANVTAIFGISNEGKLFEDVHHAFRYAIVVFEKGGTTADFAAAFRIQPREAITKDGLERFLRDPSQQVRISVATVRQLSPDSHSIPEFRSTLDQTILEKMGRHPTLGEELADAPWKLRFGREFDMTNDSDLFQALATPRRLPLFEGKMMHQFRADFAEPRYWVDAIAGRERVLGRTPDTGQALPYQGYRLAYRAIANSANERTLLVSLLPANVFCGHSLNVDRSRMRAKDSLYLLAVMNSFTLDYRLRLSVSANLTMFFLYQLPIPRLPQTDSRYEPLMRRAALLVCTTLEFDALAQSAGLSGHEEAITIPEERAEVRAELDALVAHLYDLTEVEYAHVLESFPLVKAETKSATLAAFRALLPDPDEATLAKLINQGEGRHLEFKCGAYHNPRNSQLDGSMLTPVVTAVASFLNSPDGGSVLLGVADKPVRPVGIEDDLTTGNFTNQAQPEDAYALALSQAVSNRLGGHLADLLTITFPSVGGHKLCRLAVRPADGPVYLQGELHIRGAKGKQKLATEDAIKYVARRFPKP